VRHWADLQLRISVLVFFCFHYPLDSVLLASDLVGIFVKAGLSCCLVPVVQVSVFIFARLVFYHSITSVSTVSFYACVGCSSFLVTTRSPTFGIASLVLVRQSRTVGTLLPVAGQGVLQGSSNLSVPAREAVHRQGIFLPCLGRCANYIQRSSFFFAGPPKFPVAPCIFLRCSVSQWFGPAPIFLGEKAHSASATRKRALRCRCTFVRIFLLFRM
jgi:hypothetical protein